MSLQERILAQSKLDADLLLQNDRIGRNARKQENTVLSFKQVDEELLREYNEEFPKKFEFTDEVGDKKYAKYMLPENAPNLEAPNIQNILSDVDLQRLEDNKLDTLREIEVIKNVILQNAIDKRDVNELLNNGTIAFQDGLNELNRLKFELTRSTTDLNNLEHDLITIEALRSDNERAIKDNEAEITKTTQENKQKIEKYKEELNLLNKKAFNTEQLPNETEEQYYTRLRSNAEFTEPEENLENAKKIVLDRFKNSLKEIIRNPSKIEQISNSLDIFPEVENKFKLLKKWNLFKTTFVKTFGENNATITVDEIIEFMREFLRNDGVVTTVRNITQKLVKNTQPVNTQPISTKEQDIADLTQQLLQKYPKSAQMIARLQDYNTTANLTNTNNYFQNIQGKQKKKLAKKIATEIIDKNTTNNVVGFGVQMEKIPEKVTFGKLVLLLDKLYYKNILAVKHHNMISIVGLKNTKVSDKFVKIIMNMIDNINPTTQEINGLSTQEKQLYDRLIYLAGLNKMMPHTRDKTINDYKKQMKLIEGEISAGNNSPLLLQELYVVVHSLKDFGILSPKEIKSYLAQF